MRHHIRNLSGAAKPQPLPRSSASEPLSSSKRTSVFRITKIYQESPLIPVQANPGGVTHMNYKLVLESAPGQQCTHTEHQPQDEEVKERPGPSTVLYLSVLHPWGWTVLGLALASIRTWGRADSQRNTRATQYCEAEHKLGKRHIGLRLQQEAGERPPSTSHVSLRQNEMAPSNTWESPAHCTCPALVVVKKARQRLVLLDRSETLSSHSRCLETFTWILCRTIITWMANCSINGCLALKRVDCGLSQPPPPSQLAGHIPQMLQVPGKESS